MTFKAFAASLIDKYSVNKLVSTFVTTTNVPDPVHSSPKNVYQVRAFCSLESLKLTTGFQYFGKPLDKFRVNINPADKI